MEVGMPKCNREWFYFIGIVCLVELIFLHVIYTYGHDAEVKAAWDFAAVLISIILAIIAILYSMVQSITQQSSSERLAGQISSLEHVVADVRTSKDALSTELDLIGQVTGKLEDFASDLKTQGTHISGLHTTVGKIAAELSAKQASQSKSGEAAVIASPAAPNVQAFADVAVKLSYGPTLAMYAIAKSKGKLKDAEVVKAIAPIFGGKNAAEGTRGVLLGTFLSTRRFFWILGYVDKSTDDAKMLPEYEVRAFEILAKPGLFKGDLQEEFNKTKKTIDDLVEEHKA